MFIAMVAALVVAAIVAFGAASSAQAFAADDDGSATATADIVLVAPGGDGNGSGSGNGSATRGATTRTGDPLAWGSLLAVAALAAGVAVFARRQALAGASGGPAPTRSTHARPSVRNRTVSGSRTASASATRRRSGAYARPSAHARSGSHAKRSAVNWGRVGVAALAVALVALAASTVMVFSARAANDTIRIEMQQAEDGSWSGTATYYVNNDATYYRDLAKITEAAANGFNLEDGSVAITIAPASDPDDAITSPDAVKGAATSGGATWRIAGSAVSEDHNLALKVTATAKSLKPGDNTVGTATFDMTAPPYEDLRVRLNASPVVGMPLAASVSGAPEEAANDFTYTWLVSDDGENWTAIPGATSATFTPTPDLAGKRISVSLGCANPAWFIVQPASHNAKAPTSRAAAEGEHTVVFDVHGHGDAPEAQIVSDGAYAAQPADPTASGFTFGGWFADEECTQPFSFSTTPITEDMTLHALWVPDTTGTFTVVHMLQSADADDDYDEGAREVRTGEFSGNLADIQKSFPGFSLNVAKSPESSDEDGAHVLRVYYDRRAYTVTYHVDNDIFRQETQVRYGATLTAPSPGPELVGKVFEGWTTDGTALYDFAKPVTGDLDLYAKFSVQKLTVTFETWGQAPKPDGQTVEYGNKATEPAEPAVGDGPESGPTFQGWYKDSELTIPFDFGAEVITEDTVIYAKYSPHVLFVLGDKGASVVFPVKLGADMSIDVTNPKATKATSDGADKTISAKGYKIKGWHKDPGLADTAVTSLTDIREDVKLYPAFEPNTYKVKFDKNDDDATNTMADQEFTYDVEQALTANAFALQGYTFAGWNTEEDGSGTGYADTEAVKNLATGDAGDESITLYAQWSPATDTPYKVEHYQQTADGTGYILKETESLTGTTGATVTATPKAYTGFTHNPGATDAYESGAIAANGGLVLKVYYDRDTYTVTFDLNGAAGTAPAAKTGVRYGAKVSAPSPEPTADGYTFEGWYTESGCTTEWVFGTDTVTEDVTLYAKWEGKTFTISFDANDSNDATGTTDSVQAKIGSSVTLTANGFSRTGFTFAGWNTKEDGSGAAFADSASVAAASVSPKGDDVTLYAQWTGLPVTYTVKHYTQDTLNDNANYTLVDTESSIPGIAGQNTAAAAKTYAGYDCVGTDKAGNLEQVPIAGDSTTVVEIYYDIHSWKVTFVTWDQDTVSPNPQQVANTATASDPGITSATGQPQFENWYDNSSFTGSPFNFSTPITADKTLYAKYNLNLLVDFQGKATNVSFPKVLNSDFLETELSGVSVAGYSIGGWYEDSSFSTTQAFPITMDNYKTVYPELIPDANTSYKTEYYWQSLTDDSVFQLYETVPDTGTTDTTANADIKTYPGFTHDENNADKVETGTIAGDGSLVLKVYYTRNTNTPYTVRHWLQNVDGTYPDTSADTPKDEDATKTGKTGASTAAAANTYEGFTAQPFSQKTIDGDGTTVVDIKYARKTFTVTFNNQGHGTTPAVQTVRYEDVATEPNPEPTEIGYTFGGWYTTQDCYNGEEYDFDTPVTENKTLYAKWTAKLYDVRFSVPTYIADQPNVQKVAYGQHADKPEDSSDPLNTNYPAKPGYKFIDWYHEADFSTIFEFTVEVIKKNIIVYGKFTPNKYNIAFDANDGTGTMATLENVEFNEEKELTANAFTRAGYTFRGWNTVKTPDETTPGKAFNDEATVEGLSTEDGATVALYAQWKANANTPYKVEHYRQKLNVAGTDVAGTTKDSSYELTDTQNLTGTTDTQTEAAALTAGEYAYFVPEDITQVNIDGDGTTVVKVYYNRKTYTVTYNENGGDFGTAPAEQKKPYGATLALSGNEPTKTGMPTYTVSYNVNGGNALDNLTDANTKAAEAGQGYSFNSWNTVAAGGGDTYAPSGTYTANTDATLYAQWNEVTVEETPVTLPTPTRTGYTFLGWYTNAEDGTTKIGDAGDEYMPSNDIELTAVWTEHPYTITFVPNGAASATAYATSDFDQSLLSYTQVVDPTIGYTIEANRYSSPTNDSGAKFIGWNTAEDGTGRWVLPGEHIAANDSSMTSRFTQPAHTVTLYAQWSHLAGLTAAELADNNAYTTYSRYVGDVWIPVTASGDTTAYDRISYSTASSDYSANETTLRREVNQVLICTLIGAGDDGDNMLTFASRALPIYNMVSSHIWSTSALRESMNEGGIFTGYPSSLKATDVVKEIAHQSYDSANGNTPYWNNSTEKFWLLGNTSCGFTAFSDGPIYSGLALTNESRKRIVGGLNDAYGPADAAIPYSASSSSGYGVLTRSIAITRNGPEYVNYRGYVKLHDGAWTTSGFNQAQMCVNVCFCL